MGITQGTLSEATTKLEELGYIDVTVDPHDERRRRLRLTSKGVEAMKGASVLDTERLAAAVTRLSAQDCALVVRGLRLLAEAAESMDTAPVRLPR